MLQQILQLVKELVLLQAQTRPSPLELCLCLVRCSPMVGAFRCFQTYFMQSHLTDYFQVQDENLKRLMMSWYFAGYYTGLYEGQQQAKHPKS